MPRVPDHGGFEEFKEEEQQRVESASKTYLEEAKEQQ